MLKLKSDAFRRSIEDKKRAMFHIEHGDNLAILRSLTPNSFDAMVTDPPCGIAFMGKDWDKDKGGRDEWIRWMAETMAEALRVLKPGAHALVWAIPRTQHWTMMALENAGFIVRDVVYHMYGQGFPKSQDISKAIDKAAGAERTMRVNERWAERYPNGPGGNKTGGDRSDKFSQCKSISGNPLLTSDPVTSEAQKWSGWGTHLKPSCEPWILVQKPLSENTIAANVLKHGAGGLNIDAARIDLQPGETTHGLGKSQSKNPNTSFGDMGEKRVGDPNIHSTQGRFPANVILDEDAAKVLDEQTGDLGKSSGGSASTPKGFGEFGGGTRTVEKRDPGFGDSGGASRFFYTAKASKSEKGEGNGHPTVKPIKLMEYLIKLITPPGGTVLDPFMGSGTTGVAAIRNGFKFFGIDQDKQYSEIAIGRLFNEYSIDPKSILKAKGIPS